MSITNFPNGLSSFGVPLFGLGGMIPIPGNVYYLDNDRGLDSNNGLDPTRPKQTLSNVQSVMTANQNDVAILIGHSSAGTGAFRESSDLLWTKNLTHIVGIVIRPSPHLMMDIVEFTHGRATRSHHLGVHVGGDLLI